MEATTKYPDLSRYTFPDSHKDKIKLQGSYQLIIDCTTWLEHFLVVVGIIFSVPLALFLADFFSQSHLMQSVFEDLNYTVIMTYLGMGTIIAWMLMFTTSVYYILDFETRELSIHRKVWGHSWDSPVCRFKNINSIATGGMVPVGRFDRWCYGAFILLDSGKKIRLTDKIREMDECDTISKLLAEILDVEFVPGKKNRCLKIRVDSATGKLQISELNQFQAILGSPIGIAFILLMVVLIIHLFPYLLKVYT